MTKVQYFIYALLLLVSFTGCASLGEIFKAGIKEPPKERFFYGYLRKARALEKKGDLVGALKHYKLALTLNPSSQQAQRGRRRLEGKVRREAEKHYRAGLSFQKEGKYSRARQEFLLALRLKPDYPEVVEMLISRKRIRIKRYVTHTIKPGESLSKVAKLYYGDYQKFPIIAKYNNITDATRVRSGQQIKVPEIEGADFRVSRKPVETKETEMAYSGSWDWEAYPWEVQEAERPDTRVSEPEEEAEDPIAIYRDHGIELYGKKEYQEALAAFQLVLEAKPEDKIAQEYAYKSHFQNAKALFEREDYMEARREFEASLRYKGDCQECRGYVKESEERYKEKHYRLGIEYFGKEQLKEAIIEWELVRALDPEYKRVEYLINKAKTILKNIEKIKEDVRKELQE